MVCESVRKRDFPSVMGYKIPPEPILSRTRCMIAQVAVCSLMIKAITQRFVHKAECSVHHHTLIKSPKQPSV